MNNNSEDESTSHQEVVTTNVAAGPVTMSTSIAELAGALAAAQGEIETAKKDRVNTHFSARYATLAASWEACRAALSKNAIAVIQSPVDGADETRIGLVTLLAHKSGQWMRSEMSAPVMPQVTKTDQVGKRTPQSVGSAITYLRRYALQAMVGVSSDDDDGALASGNASAPSATPATQSPAVAEQDALEATYTDAIKSLKTPAEFKALGAKMSKVGFDAEHTARLAAIWKAGLKAVTPTPTPPVAPSAELHATKPEVTTNGAAA